MDKGAANSFDFLRLFFSVLVIYSHAYALSGDAAGDFLTRWTAGRLGFGSLAVYCFFVISGYLIAASFERSSSLWSFAKRRFGRIYPGFIAMMVILHLIIIPMARPQGAPRLDADYARIAVIRTLTLQEVAWPDAFAANSMPGMVNGSSWTIKYEFACYMMIAAIGVMAGIHRPNRLIAVSFGLWLLCAALQFGWLERPFAWDLIGFESRRFAPCALYFLGGSIVWCYRQRLMRANGVGCAILFVACTQIRHGVELAGPLLLAVALLSFAHLPIRPLQDWARRLRGDYSYGTYLYAFPVQQLVLMWAGGTMSPMANFWISMPIALLFGVMSWHGVERWFMPRRHGAPAEPRVDHLATAGVP